MVYEALCAYLGQAADAAVLPESPSMQIKGGILGAPDMLALLRQRWDMRETHAALAAVVAGDEGRAGFDRLRREFPERHEVAGVEIRGEVHGSWASVLTALGATFLPDA